MEDEDYGKVSHPNFKGQKDYSLFFKDLFWLYDSKDFDHTNQRLLEVIQHTRSTKDERALVLVSCLLVENAVEEFLLSFSPHFRKLLQNRDFTLSMKIGIAKALSLCPSWLLNCADAIRSIRNDFAHNLQINSLDKAKREKINLILEYYQTLYPGASIPSSNADIFSHVVGRLILGLHIYRNQVRRLSQFIRSDEFMATFEYFVNPLLAKRPVWLDNPDVGRTVENGGKRAKWEPDVTTYESLKKDESEA